MPRCELGKFFFNLVCYAVPYHAKRVMKETRSNQRKGGGWKSYQLQARANYYTLLFLSGEGCVCNVWDR